MRKWKCSGYLIRLAIKELCCAVLFLMVLYAVPIWMKVTNVTDIEEGKNLYSWVLIECKSIQELSGNKGVRMQLESLVH
ncbi:hypothetical protein QE152_g24323 [Popillia japonica]|uniref:Uncharacterized protein n=1 Tax=Popillia japonica TaxID=7064 RepID=A0AAW1KG95_POPJA